MATLDALGAVDLMIGVPSAGAAIFGAPPPVPPKDEVWPTFPRDIRVRVVMGRGA